MERFLRQGVKEIILTNPKIGEILTAYGIGCTECTLGSCQLKDVVTIHHLPGGTEACLMQEIEVNLYPERAGRTTRPTPPVRPEKQELKYSPPIQRLVAEHSLIKRWLKLVPFVIKHFSVDPGEAWQWISEGVDFSSSYADKYHHAKEEDILFAYAGEASEIIQVMLDDHVAGRNHIQGVAEAIKEKDESQAIQHLLAYRELLREHIKKEDEILFPWIDRGLATSTVGKLYRDFDKIAAGVGVDFTTRYEDFITGVEERFF